MAAATSEFGRRRRFLRTVTATGHLSSYLLLLPSNMQFRCMKYLVFLAIYKIFLYPLGFKNFWFCFGQEYFLHDSLFRRFFLLFWFSFWVTDLHRFLLPTATIRG